MLAFYQTPAGQKAIQLMPMILQDSVMVGRQWSEKQMPRIMATVQAKLRAEGFIK